MGWEKGVQVFVYIYKGETHLGFVWVGPTPCMGSIPPFTHTLSRILEDFCPRMTKAIDTVNFPEMRLEIANFKKSEHHFHETKVPPIWLKLGRVGDMGKSR